ncbi:hypothetical protein GTO91_03040 [Heliobacterium undosum]|uniref:Scaffolding protein n=1 Tax=Heliomicrobium undosum TaxID=121734 RepID=A0A845L1M1_9FIRM|nr:hypothetical protein [Heliomicrobium undosum]MZP28694.1 hypothetical protein [Heliomicrobium undosum]
MAEETQVQEQQTTAPEAPATKEPEGKPQEHLIPKSRFDEVNTKYKDVQGKLDQLLAERDTQAKKTKEQQGKFEELYKTAADELTKTKDGYKTASSRVEQLESVINGLLEAKLEGIPKDFHDLVPGNLTPEAKLEWLAMAEQKGLFGTGKQEQPVGQATNPAQAQTTDLNQLSSIQLLKMGYAQRA